MSKKVGKKSKKIENWAIGIRSMKTTHKKTSKTTEKIDNFMRIWQRCGLGRPFSTRTSEIIVRRLHPTWRKGKPQISAWNADLQQLRQVQTLKANFYRVEPSVTAMPWRWPLPDFRIGKTNEKRAKSNQIQKIQFKKLLKILKILKNQKLNQN